MSHNSRDSDATRFDEPAATRGVGERSRLITIDSRDPEPAEPRAAILAGTQLGPYRINRLLGKGGMGEVYELVFKRFMPDRTLTLGAIAGVGLLMRHSPRDRRGGMPYI